jgi:hypothetical protein
MILKRFTALFFILVFSLLFAPVMQVGSFLYQNQLTEEIPHGSCDGGNQASKNFDPSKNFEYYSENLFQYHPSSCLYCTVLSHSERYTSRHSDDINTPPPNCIA